MFPYSFKFSSISSRSGARIFFRHNRADHSCDALRLRYDQWRGQKTREVRCGQGSRPNRGWCLSVRPSIHPSVHLSIHTWNDLIQPLGSLDQPLDGQSQPLGNLSQPDPASEQPELVWSCLWPAWTILWAAWSCLWAAWASPEGDVRTFVQTDGRCPPCVLQGIVPYWIRCPKRRCF